MFNLAATPSRRMGLEAGYRTSRHRQRHHNEDAVGRAIKRAASTGRNCSSPTKLWNQDMRDHAGKTLGKAWELLTDYLDLFADSLAGSQVYKESWKIMEEFYKEGKIRAIGVSNFQIHHLDDLLRDAEVVPAVNQIECHPISLQAAF